MRRIALILCALAGLGAALATSATGDDSRTYEIEMYNAFGLVTGSDVRVAGVNAGSVTDLDVNSKKRAVVTVELSGPLAVLGEDTTCSSEPQSLIAEYFIDCQPDGPEIEASDEPDPENPDIPAEHVEQTVQTDLVNNTLREPFKRRLQLLINEFGTALAGNPENLNEAIRLGAPALAQTEKVLRVLGQQNRIIRNLNVDSDSIIARLAQRRDDVVRFIQEARDTAVASAERRDDLSTDFGRLDEFLDELNPTLAELEALAQQGTPLLTDLRASAPGLNRLVLNLPAFNAATEDSLDSLGEASQTGRRAVIRGREEFEALADSGRNATSVGEMLKDFLVDLDDPSRAVEVDQRAANDTKRDAPTGYTGLEGLLNYAYYQAGSTNQFDEVGHLLHFSLYYIFTGPCGEFTTGRDPETGAPGLPAEGGGTTTDITQLDKCIGWLGPNQPGITQDSGLPPYDESVCPDGTEPPQAAATLCGPGLGKTGGGSNKKGNGGNGGGASGGDGTQGGGGPQIPGLPDLPGLPGGGGLPNDLDDLLDLPPNLFNDLPQSLQDRLNDLRGNGGRGGHNGGGNGGHNGGGSSGGGNNGGGGGVGGLLDYLLG